MDRVNITTTTTCKGPGKQKAIGMFLVERIHDGIPETMYKFLDRDSITSKELSLQLLANAMYIVNHAKTDFDSIEIYSDEPYVVAAFENKWIEKWNKDNWKNSKGKDVADAKTWQMICNLMNESGKRFIFAEGLSSYSNWMYLQMKKREERSNEQRYEEKSADDSAGTIKARLYYQGKRD